MQKAMQYEMTVANAKAGKQEVVRLVPFDVLTANFTEEQKYTYAEVIADFVDKKVEGDAQMLEVTPEDILNKRLGIIALKTGALVDTPPSQQATEVPNDAPVFELPQTPEGLTDNIVGYVGATAPIEHTVNGKTYHMTEVGSLKVAEKYRGKGLGGEMLRLAVILALEQGLVPYAFCNEHSLPLAQSITPSGVEGHEAETTEVPPAALDLCKGCPKYCEVKVSKTNPCCDTVWIWYPEKQQASPNSPSNS